MIQPTLMQPPQPTRQEVVQQRADNLMCPSPGPIPWAACVGLVLSTTHMIVCVEWVLHTTHVVYGFPANGHAWGITKLDIVLKIYSNTHDFTLQTYLE